MSATLREMVYHCYRDGISATGERRRGGGRGGEREREMELNRLSMMLFLVRKKTPQKCKQLTNMLRETQYTTNTLVIHYT